ncbi:uncharacterized protein I206_100088 [Kwoniella pini CBS 10737]|uniref:Uncharacterized protein n=1 Tax=Kwoniella pini CBS 10737 TaxID=1296096 RepID=A0A1B9IEG7_9TREE|nr:uncharacterized protein I206_01240 [Kwoniella pini CBS 10737]OCF53933.1 hypothetical protein I206_01240 [Kwoniella pini CBS 10737]
MPSLFSKFRHRKSASQSSNTSDTSQPASPSRARKSVEVDQSRSPITPSRQNVQQFASPSAKQPDTQSPIPHIPTTRTEEDVVVIDKYSSSAGNTDKTGHSKPFVDENDRPDLPTTTSNVNNPIPVPRNGGSSDSTAYLPKDVVKKPLPSIPQGHQGSQNETNVLNSFPTPPAQEPFVPTKSPERQSFSHHSDPAHTRSPPLPHVDSVNRDAILRSEEERPGIVGSTSRPIREGEGIEGNYPHVSKLPHSHKEENLDELANIPSEKVDIPSRGSSLYHQPGTNSNSGIEAQPRVQLQKQSQLRNEDQHDEDRPPQLPELQFEQQQHRRQGDWTKPSSAIDPISSHRDGVLNERFNDLSLKDGKRLGLEEQRDLMINKLTQDAEARAEKRKDLSADGVETFKKAGMEKLLDKESSIDIRTKELEPVVKETIIPLEHTEYTTIITRDIHKTHYIPIIQPIHDPDPIILATRHRIFNPTTGKWHEVIGDAAARAILGEEAFRNGPRETRELRKPAMEGLEPMDEDAIRMAQEAGLLSGDGLTSLNGIRDYEYNTNAQTKIPLKGEYEDVTLDGIGSGEGKGRVLEREYPLGAAEDEEKGEWKEIASYVGIGKGKGKSLLKGGNNDDQVGVAM